MRGSKAAKRYNKPALPLHQNDNRPREERALNEIHPHFNTYAPIILMNVPQYAMATRHEERSRSNSDEEIGDRVLLTTIDSNSLLPGAIRRIQRAKEHTKPAMFEIIKDAFKPKRPPSRSIDYIPDKMLKPVEYDSIIEYDLDPYDRTWLNMYNQKRKEKNLPSILESQLEWTFNALEKEWYKLIYPVMMEQSEHLYPDDGECSICGNSEASNTDMIIFCDRCDVAVHQECYGIPNVPEGKWLCLPCAWSPNQPIQCALCPYYEGAFKQTESGEWAHTLCAHWVDETGFSNETYLEPITGVADVPKTRWSLKCKLCGFKGIGAPIQCSVRHCGFAYHPYCARKGKLWMDYHAKKSFCPKHTPKDHILQLRGIDLKKLYTTSNGNEKDYVDFNYFRSFFMKTKVPSSIKNTSVTEGGTSSFLNGARKNKDRSNSSIVISGGDGSGGSSSSSSLKHCMSSVKMTLASVKRALSQSSEEYNRIKEKNEKEEIKISQIPPVVPEYLLYKLLNYNLKDVDIKDKEHYLIDACKYWTLKRERKGAPLIKRLQMEPIQGSVIYDSEQLKEKLYYLKPLRHSLESLRLCCELVQRIQVIKLKAATEARAVIQAWRHPLVFEMKEILLKLKKLDSKGFFERPVDKSIVYDYYDIIKRPMDFYTMETKINEGQYYILQEFTDDFKLICSNAMTYNKETTVYYKAAARVLDAGMKVIEKESRRLNMLNIHDLDDSLSISLLNKYLLPFPLDLEAELGIQKKDAIDIDN